jgi:GDP-fucose protein O-fucosyltransferase
MLCKVRDMSAEDIYELNTKQFLKEGSTVYIATDEQDMAFFEPLAKHYNLLFLKDFKSELVGVNTNFYGMIDQLIASRGDIFVGVILSTFTGMFVVVLVIHIYLVVSLRLEENQHPTDFFSLSLFRLARQDLSTV